MVGSAMLPEDRLDTLKNYIRVSDELNDWLDKVEFASFMPRASVAYSTCYVSLSIGDWVIADTEDAECEFWNNEDEDGVDHPLNFNVENCLRCWYEILNGYVPFRNAIEVMIKNLSK